MSGEHPAGGDGPRSYRIEALIKGLRVLSLFSEQRQSMRLTDIAAAGAMLVPTAHRVIGTLVAEGYLERLPDGRYRPGVSVLSLGFAALRSLDLTEVATRELRLLADSTGETVNMAVLSHDRIIYLVRLRNADLVTANIQVGSTLPAVYTSIGKLLLASLSAEDLRERISPASFPGGGPRAAATLEDLRAPFETIRRLGYAVQSEEVASGLRSVAAPIRGESGAVVAGANIAVNAHDWSEERMLTELKPPLLATSAAISRLLGYR